MSKIITTKKELTNSLNNFDDNDRVVIEVHDTVLDEDLYSFYVDPIHMGVDDKNEDRGHEIRLSALPNSENWYEAYISLGEDEGTATVASFDNLYQTLKWYGELPEESEIDGIKVIKSEVSIDSWFKTLPDGQPEKSHTIF